MPDEDVRLKLLENWLDQQLPELFAEQGWGAVPAATLTSASSDASFRRYFRWQAGERSLILMDAPPPQENCEPFVRIAALLASAGVHVPQVLAADLERGFLMLDDLGRQTYLDVINEDNADDLFAAAIDALLLQQRLPLDSHLPHYDDALLRREVQLFPEWYVQRHLGLTFTPEQDAAWQRISRLLIDSALAQPKVVVHRDFMPRNLMVVESAERLTPGIIDFQDAVYGQIGRAHV